MPWIGLRCVIMVFPDHIRLLFYMFNILFQHRGGVQVSILANQVLLNYPLSSYMTVRDMMIKNTQVSYLCIFLGYTHFTYLASFTCYVHCFEKHADLVLIYKSRFLNSIFAETVF